jgi:hypothetical protein
VDLEAARDADLLLNLSYDACAGTLERFSRTAMVDIDPGLTQVWASEGSTSLPAHDVYFTTSETVGDPAARFPSGDIAWEYTPPPVALDWWPVSDAFSAAAFTTVSHWGSSREWVARRGVLRKRQADGISAVLDLPRHTGQPLELALCLPVDEKLELIPDARDEQAALEERGWRVVHSHAVASTPRDYQRYIQASRGEFSCVKPSCVRLQNAWIGDRTPCYLASGKPAVIQHSGPSRLLPCDAGPFRFRDLEEAVRCLETVACELSETMPAGACAGRGVLRCTQSRPPGAGAGAAVRDRAAW